MDKLVSSTSKSFIQSMLTDTKIKERITENTKKRDKYRVIDILDDGNIVLGETPVRFWNRLIGCQTVIPFESFALKIWDALVDLSSGINNEAITEGLSREIVMKSMRNKDYNWVIHRLFDCWLHVANKSLGFTESGSPEGEQVLRALDGNQIGVVRDRKIVLSINGEERVLPILDSIGDPLRVGLKYGITGVTVIE